MKKEGFQEIPVIMKMSESLEASGKKEGFQEIPIIMEMSESLEASGRKNTFRIWAENQ